MSEQYNNVRRGTLCVACGKNDKPEGLLLHWECHAAQKARNDGDYSSRVNRMLAALERTLSTPPIP